MQIVKGDQNGYPVSGGIDGSPCPGGCKHGGLGVGRQADNMSLKKNLTVRKPNL